MYVVHILSDFIIKKLLFYKKILYELFIDKSLF